MNTTYLLNQAAQKVWGDSDLYLGLSTTAPSIDGTGDTEPVVDGNGYGRAKIANLSAPVDGVITNTADISMPRILKPSGDATYWVVYDSPTVGSGNLLYFAEIPEAIRLGSNTVVCAEPGTLKLKALNPVPVTA